MVERKPFKTKLCVLYQRGRCSRETCTFAHGDSELRRQPTSFTERRLHRDNDLRNKLDRKRSPAHRCSPATDALGSRAYKRLSPTEPNKRRKLRTHENVDDPNDLSGGFKSLDGSADSRRDHKMDVSSNSRKVLEDELKQVQYEVNVLYDLKSQMEIELEERVQEADSLSSRIRDLEAQLSEEKDNSKRVNSKLKKLIRAQVHHSRLQYEVKRSQVQLELLVGELGKDALSIGAGEDKLNVNIISDEEVQELKDPASPVKKDLHSSMKASRESKSANTAKVHGATVTSSRRNSLVRFDDHQKAEMGNKRKNLARSSIESNPRPRNNVNKPFESLDKLKVPESNLLVPPTSMAAHAFDDFVEMEAEKEKNTGVLGSPNNVENGFPNLLPPLPTVRQSNYYQYEGVDGNAGVDRLEEEREEVDIV